MSHSLFLQIHHVCPVFSRHGRPPAASPDSDSHLHQSWAWNLEHRRLRLLRRYGHLWVNQTNRHRLYFELYLKPTKQKVKIFVLLNKGMKWLLFRSSEISWLFFPLQFVMQKCCKILTVCLKMLPEDPIRRPSAQMLPNRSSHYYYKMSVLFSQLFEGNCIKFTNVVVSYTKCDLNDDQRFFFYH